MSDFRRSATSARSYVGRTYGERSSPVICQVAEWRASPGMDYPVDMKNVEVDNWFADYENPMKDVVLRMRDIILASDPRIEECIKWKSPTFTYKGNIASFNPRSKKHASLMFHTGASIPGDYPHLAGEGDVARYLKAGSVEEVDALKEELIAIVSAWCDMKDGGT